MKSILPLLIFLLFLQVSEAKSNWVIDYNYDQPYEALNVSNENLGRAPVLIPRYRLSFFQELARDFGYRLNLQRDNYFYGLNQKRSYEYNASSLDLGLFKSYDDILIEFGKSNSDSPIWKKEFVGTENEKKYYVRFGKHHFLKDKLGLNVKVSASEISRNRTIEIKLTDMSSPHRTDFKLRLDRTPQMSGITKKTESVINVTVVFGF